MTKAIIFDSDGMLTHGPRFSAKYAAEHGISIDVMNPFFDGPFKDCLVGKSDLKAELENGWLDKWSWKGTSDELLAYWFSCGDELDQSVFETISSLRKKGVICVLATNQEKYRTDYLSEKFGYVDAFNKVFSSAYVGFKKPHEDFFDVVFEYFQSIDDSITKADVLFWDDDIKNVEGAKSFGFQAVQYRTQAEYIGELNTLSLL
jgi:putative hydrolase of the HAD superfamily